ncbi:ATP-binding cassette domain-containing protein [Epidermidibacterium keratini]|uniref:ATP-binding cassette domain-containing protein n=1 Tax=Epidermidibacterium keratini TaxID=1891644 RepID=A0A7L4YL15_9ACTN|nr:ATP-binding cassette domain-containing protein [Epidermidibacterium keratini]QHB99533.1 ATP-binding cassette domain-containing protein [Epidermidibacterium keratini]
MSATSAPAAEGRSVTEHEREWPAVEIRNLRFCYPGAENDTLRSVDLTIERGDFVAVVGGNGSGKTTLCKSFNGLIPHFWNGDISGTVRIHGKATADRTVGEIANQVGYVFQDFGNQLVRPRVHDDVAFAPINFGHADWKQRADDALSSLGIAHLAGHYTWQLSGGQQHLTALGGALALAPSVLVVDEPAAEVDPMRATAIYEQLTRLNSEQGITVVVIEHHAELVARYATSVVLMADGQVQWHLPVAEAMSRTADLEAADIPAPQVVAAARALLPEVADGRSTPPLTVESAAEQLNELPARNRSRSTSNAPQPVAAASSRGETIAELERVTHGYIAVGGGRSTVLDGLSLQLHDGERVALVGTNGAGKSTLLSVLAGLAVPSSGRVVVDGRDTRSVTAAELADTVCYLVQRPEEMFLQDSIRGDIAMFPRTRKVPDAEELVDQILEQMKLTDLQDRDGRLLSGGQQRRATLAIALAMRPRLLLLDEPTSSLDVRSRDDVIGLLTALAEHIRCTVVATHDMHLVAEWADRVIVLDQGEIIADTDPATLFASPQILTQARLMPPQVAALGAELGLDPVPLSVGELVDRLRRTRDEDAR